MANGKRAALYLRVSTGEQTVEGQRRDLEASAAQRGWVIVETYTDNGISGTKGRDKRPGLDKLLKDATRGRFDVAMAWSSIGWVEASPTWSAASRNFALPALICFCTSRHWTPRRRRVGPCTAC